MPFQDQPPAYVEAKKAAQSKPATSQESHGSNSPNISTRDNSPVTIYNAPPLRNPTFREKVEEVYFSLGHKGGTFRASFSELQTKKLTPFAIGHFTPIKVYVKGDVLFADVQISGPNGKPPVEVKENVFIVRPVGWDKNSDNSALEVVNEDLQPVFQMIYLTPSHIQVNGILSAPGLVIIGDNLGMRTIGGGPPSRPQVVITDIDRIFKYPSIQHPGERK